MTHRALFALALLACNGDKPDPSTDPLPDPEEDADIFVDTAGEPVPWLDADTLAQFERGRVVMERAFTSEDGLGPTFNADSCAGCHQFPAAGGSSPRYRDFWLVKRERWDGALEDVGSNGESPVRNLYATGPSFHIAEPEDTTTYARRNAPPGFGVGLFAFVSEETILACADPADADGDGISGRANFEQGLVGRFGYKAQATSLESFNRGAIFNQMGITSDPLFHTFPEDPDAQASLIPSVLEGGLLIRSAHAQVSAPDEPTLDDDDAPDPEISNADQLDLLVFSTYLGVPRPAEPTDAMVRGAEAFGEAECGACHIPRLDSTIGPLPAYTDLLLHDMGEELADGIGAGLATGSEFRTQPLWGVALHGPFLHDGRAQTLDEAIRLHGGEGEHSAALYAALSDGARGDLVAFLEGLGGSDPAGAGLLTYDTPPPSLGEPGGPDVALDASEEALWLEGRAYFGHNVSPEEGLGWAFNADSCRACHQDPVLGGAGGIDTNVLRYGHRDADGVYSALDSNVLPRVVLDGLPPRLPDEANIIEPRQPPSVLGLGEIERIPADDVLAHADPDDLDGDGISGRARVLDDGRLGRFGWKAQIPTLLDFAADALLNENGSTVDTALTSFSSDDDGDAHADPELPTSTYEALAFYIRHLAPPTASSDTDTDAGAALFADVGCDGCHVPEISGVALYSDLLLHDVAPDALVLVDQEGEAALPTEFRTPPLWGIAETAPYLHDGSAVTLSAAITTGHAGEAQASRDAFDALSDADQAELVAFLEAL